MSFTLDEVHKYWAHPDIKNLPSNYISLETIPRSICLAERGCTAIPKDARIVELGCNVGRNLYYLKQYGYTNLSGIEINSDAIELGSRVYGHIGSMLHGSIESWLPRLADKSFDVLFTMSVLFHVHPESEWIFKEMVRVSKRIIIVEDETSVTPKIWARNYGHLFTLLGCTEVNKIVDIGIPKINTHVVRELITP